MNLSWMARRWCLVEQDEQLDLFVEDFRHVHLVDINLRLDVPRERTLCGDLLPSLPVYRELTRADARTLCPACVNHAEQTKGGARRSSGGRSRPATAQMQQFDLNMTVSGS
ncbi:hypothetical protein [Halopseudomonas maritima]|uniref:hypothetical protein n=1 Tax=Halopseudomonas maritima TaxID=2918528 RepID=UPI001EE9BB7D|nr:hypothetical protein [Halopseudomonas maritima]UJJ31779.1 hypothetical protein HV822_00930 [Halopseudomonas maritima]